MLDTVIRRTIKAAVLPAGAVSRPHSGDIVMLLYHRLGDERSEIAISPATFDRQLRSIAAQGRGRTLDEALAGPGGIVVTFDDGTLDFYAAALPLISKHRIPVLLYLATGGVSGEGLSWSHLAESVATGLVTVGSHTHGHADLSRATEREADEEMRRSKELIEDRLGVACAHFSYPWGVGSPAADRVARRLFASAALDGWRTNRRGRLDRYRLGRVPILRSDGHLFFRAKAAGRLNAERVVYRALGRGPWSRSRPTHAPNLQGDHS